MPPENPAPTAFFDYDGTLIEGDSILFWHRHYYARRPWMRVFQAASWVGMALNAARVIDSHALKRVFLWPLAFENPETLDALGREFVLNDLAFRFHGPVLARLWAHHRLGHRVVVISASGTFYLRHLAELLPPGCVVLGTEMRWEGGFLRLPSYRGGNLRGPNKITRLRDLGYAGAGKGGFAYSDHPHDVPLLEFVDHPNCIRPTRGMAAEAGRHGWPVWEWPRARAAWKVKAEALFLLLFAWSPKFLAAPKESPKPDEAEVERQEKLIGIETQNDGMMK
ncbi:MAG TPA: HAD-IB family phosphatase [Fibrobacteria bacterium]|nr:HAD-IB family phosphatase [Fibrobacteria bacterium]